MTTKKINKPTVLEVYRRIKKAFSFKREKVVSDILKNFPETETDENTIKKIIIQELQTLTDLIKKNYVNIHLCMRHAMDETYGHKEITFYVIGRWPSIKDSNWYKTIVSINAELNPQTPVLNIINIWIIILMDDCRNQS